MAHPDDSSRPEPPVDPWERHRMEQTRFIAENTTAEQRFRWLEEMLVLLTPYLPKKGPLEQWPNGDPIDRT